MDINTKGSKHINLDELEQLIQGLASDGLQELPEQLYFFSSGTPLLDIQSWIQRTRAGDSVEYSGSAERITGIVRERRVK